MERNILSLFDGMSCGQQALEKSNIKFDNYIASEIDKYAIKVTMANYPNTKQIGSVVDIDCKTLPEIWMLLGGSPCQSFSFAGKRKGMSTKCEIEITTLEQYLQLKNEGYEFEGQSYLFWEYVRIFIEVKPTYFLLENVEMEEKWSKVISKALGVNPIKINAALVSAQNRVRNYWTNIGLKPSGLFGDLESIIQQPKDQNIFLMDICEKEVDEKYYLSKKMLDYFKNRAKNFNNGKVNVREENGKASTLTASMASCDISDNFIKIDTNLKPSQNQSKANCFTAGGNSGGLHSDMTLIVSSRGRNTDNPKSRQSGLATEQMIEPRIDGKSNCLTSVLKDNLVFKKNYVQWDKSGKGYNSQHDRASYENGKSCTLSSSRCETKANVILEDMTIRRLTPIECERLQGVEDNYTNHVSNTQRYRMLGNGWQIDVIAHIFSYIEK